MSVTALHSCSFCGNPQDQVAVLIAGPNNIFICDGCVALCLDVIVKKSRSAIVARFPEDAPASQPEVAS